MYLPTPFKKKIPYKKTGSLRFAFRIIADFLPYTEFVFR